MGTGTLAGTGIGCLEAVMLIRDEIRTFLPMVVRCGFGGVCVVFGWW